MIPTVIFLVLVKYVVKIWKGGAALRHLLPMESLIKVYHKILKMSSQLLTCAKIKLDNSINKRSWPGSGP